MIATNTSVLSPTTEIGDLFDFLFDPEEKPFKQNPHGFMMEPVYSAFEESPELVGFLVGVTAFSNLLDRLLPSGVNGIVCVIKDACGNNITYELNSRKATYLMTQTLTSMNAPRQWNCMKHLSKDVVRMISTSTHPLPLGRPTRQNIRQCIRVLLRWPLS
jgi:hypothetical protein